MRRRLATAVFVLATFASMSNLLAACAQTAKEDPVEEQNQQREVQQPEQTRPAEVEQTDRSIGEDIQG